MSPGGAAAHHGILFRGADGSLWFIRDDAKAPVKLDQAMTTQINQLLGSQSQWVNPPLSPAVIAILEARFGLLIQPDGVIHHGTIGGGG
jgi:hypothetical protein